MVLTPDQILEGLASLPPEKLQEAKARLSFLEAPAEESSVHPDWEIVWSEMSLLLQKNGVNSIKLGGLLKTPVGKFARKNFPILLAAVEDFKPKTKAERVKVIQLLVTWIAKDLVNRGFELQPIRYLQRLEKVSSVIERNFPGYRVAGFLPMLVSRSMSY